MRVLIISDTHGKNERIDELWEKVGEVDLLIHLGDIADGEYLLDALFDCPKHMIRGNNDFFLDLPAEKMFRLGSYKVWITHGQQYYVYSGTKRLREEGKAKGADIVMFGHTHRPYLAKEDGLLLLNPGSLSYPRQEGHRPSYMILEIDQDNQLSVEQKYL
jgi:uncharacterized protein